ncbi:MAG: helix-turn-helix domain-containing protein [Deltaproteobacteria bacterium]|nr:helix-turn-helix domain-containing protein [Deltaproteobacteria bacterium]
MSEELKIEQLISEKNLAEALGVSRSSLYELRRKGLPWINLANKTFYHEEAFMRWILQNRKRAADTQQDDTGQ